MVMVDLDHYYVLFQDINSGASDRKGSLTMFSSALSFILGDNKVFEIEKTSFMGHLSAL